MIGLSGGQDMYLMIDKHVILCIFDVTPYTYPSRVMTIFEVYEILQRSTFYISVTM